MEDFPNDYSNPRGLASEFEGIHLRSRDLQKEVKELKRDRGAFAWGLGTILAMILSWSRNASILYCIGHGIASWIYVIYFAFTR
jgi:hypothetical protein